MNKQEGRGLLLSLLLEDQTPDREQPQASPGGGRTITEPPLSVQKAQPPLHPSSVFLGLQGRISELVSFFLYILNI